MRDILNSSQRVILSPRALCAPLQCKIRFILQIKVEGGVVSAVGVDLVNDIIRMSNLHGSIHHYTFK